MWIVNLIIGLLSGAAGGNIVGNFLKDYNLGPVGNSIAGIIGGVGGGGVLMVIIGLIRQVMGGRRPA